MKILVPFKDLKTLEAFREAGAEEFYLGFYDKAYTDLFGEFCDINRMTGFKHKANPFDFKTALEAVRRIRKSGASAFVTMNANTYGKEQIGYIAKNYLPALKEAGVSGIICSDLRLAEAVRETGLNIVASTMCGIYNSDIAGIFYDNGFKRIIVPRDLSLEEIKEIKESLPQAQFEVFFMRNGCVFSDCYCLGMHRRECGATCHFIRNHSKTFMTGEKSFEGRQKIDLNNMLYDDFFHEETCGLCALYRLKEIGVGSLKIVGRSDNPNAIVKDIRLINKNIKIAEEAESEEEYLEKMIFPPNRSRKCINGLSCYYPEVRFK